MSKTEDYLDSLLNNVSSTKKTKKKSWESLSEDLIEDFEKELNDADMEDFIRKFEIDVDTEDDVDYSEGAEDSFFDNLEGIIKKAKEDSVLRQQQDEEQQDEEQQDEEQESDESVFHVNTLEDEAWTESQDTSQPETEEATDNTSGETNELLDMLAGLPSDEELSNLSDMLREDDEKYSSENNNSEVADAGEEESNQQVEENKGVFKKVKNMLFGEKEKATEEEVTEESSNPIDNEELSNMTEESLQILQELGAVENPENTPAPEPIDEEAEEEARREKRKEQKLKEKQEKKEKKEKKKEERDKKKAERKAKKESKPKKPKEVDLSPPLPKKPVILILLMGASLVVFIILVANYLGYSVSISGAKEAYAKKNYVEAYNQVAGLEVKEQDVEFSDKILLLAKVQGELNTGNTLYDNKQYMMALDAYICALGRYDTNYSEAENYEIQKEYDDLAAQITTQMTEKFGVSAETARELYGLRDRTEYTCRLQELITELGLTE